VKASPSFFKSFRIFLQKQKKIVYCEDGNEVKVGFALRLECQHPYCGVSSGYEIPTKSTEGQNKNPENKDWRKTVSQNKQLKPKFRSSTKSPKSPLYLSSQRDRHTPHVDLLFPITHVVGIN